MFRSLRTQQRAYDLHPHTIPVPTLNPHRSKESCTRSRHAASTELVSVPPVSDTPDTRSHPQLGDHHGLSVTLDQPPRNYPQTWPASAP